MRRCVIALALALTAMLVRGDDWTPPENPDPTAILREAEADTRAKRYDRALAKHVWYHDHALEFDQGQTGVRLSFALSSWLTLAEQYPPALVMLRQARDAAGQRAVAGGERLGAFAAFQEFAALNDKLDERAETRKLFETLDQLAPEQAAAVFGIARRSLIDAKAHALLAKYVSPKSDVAQMKQMLALNQKMAKENNQFGPELVRFARQTFISDAATLVAILAVNGRKAEAEEVAESVRGSLDDRAFHGALDKALEGMFPPEFPARS